MKTICHLNYTQLIWNKLYMNTVMCRIHLPMVESHAMAVHVDFTVMESLESEWRLCSVMWAMRMSSNTKKITAEAARGQKSKWQVMQPAVLLR